RMKVTSQFFSPSEEIALVLLDQESLDWAKEKLGWGWPWPRQSYALMLDYFNRGEAASVAFDMIYSEPSLYGEKDDEAFAQSSRKFGRAVQTAFYENEDDEKPVLPVPVIKDSAAILGNVSSVLDEDRIARRNYVTPEKNREYGLSVASYILKNGEIDADSVPEAKDGGMYIRYAEDLSRFAPYSAMQILQSEFALEGKTELACDEEDIIPAEQFERMYVFFGLYAPGLFDICATPVSATYPGVGVHLCQLDTILQENYLEDVPDFLNVFLILIFIAGGIFLGSSISQGKSSSLVINSLIACALVVLYLFVSVVLFVYGVILPVAVIILCFAASYILAVFEGYMTEGHQKRYLKAAFRQYLSPAVIENLIENPDMLNLGGEEREITAYFSDVQGFTSISENLSPSQLTDLLNNDLSAMTDIILSHGGTIDKYEGDAIIAFWGAPTLHKDHARRAVEAALECQKKLKEMQEELTAVSGRPFVQRIGLNTGKAVVGNMGSRSRFDYTMMGDTVNLASRLEGINKQFGTYTMCSRATMESALENGCELKFRPLAEIAVVGKKEGVKVFVPMNSSEYDDCSEIRRNYDDAYALFVKGDFKEAKAGFERTKESDAPSAKFIEKCDRLISNPPENWDGILRATEK
ncbi:MAG: adenylate/guanylate cyclase domain-containing protein, partial [Treponema sp.]|nr:adenylate/guanylate cyclase domain-containing protein [Treponema sp.]